ncbi:MAG: hypothetical protein MUO76_01380 [Anaerolineaceae bacterium]|nr:hypothetical protein [Anaerolineaceae bacterium]
MNELKVTSLIPEKQNQYSGSKLSLIFLIVWASIGVARGCIHVFAPDGGAGSIAHFDLSNGNAPSLIFIFAALGTSKLTFTTLQWIVILRYRVFIPLTLGLILFSSTLGLYGQFFKPIPNTPPGQIGNYIMVPVVLVMLVLLLIQKKAPDGS